jgi:hypothetical protein
VNYQLTIASPSSPTDTNGLRAIDGAHLASSSQSQSFFTFSAGPPGTAPALPTVDFCHDLSGMLATKCGIPICHGAPSAVGSGPAEGLVLSSPEGIQATAIGIVAHGSNTGPFAGSGTPASLAFAQDMPIIDPGPGGGASGSSGGTQLTSGDPGHSWLLYKLLMAPPQGCDPTTRGTVLCDGGAYPDAAVALPTVGGVYTVACDDAGSTCPKALAADERERLRDVVQGREMPLPFTPSLAPEDNPSGLTVQELELINLWITSGAPLPASCP